MNELFNYLKNQLAWLVGSNHPNSSPVATDSATANAQVTSGPDFQAFKTAVFPLKEDVVGYRVARSNQKGTNNLVPLDNTTLAALARTSSGMNALFQPVLDQRRLKMLLVNVSRGNTARAEVLIKAKPRLLYLEGTIQDFAGRTLKGTPLRIALASRNARSNNISGEMLEMIVDHLRHQSDGKAEIAKQVAAQFPEGWEEVDNARKQADSLALKRVFSAIGASTTDEEGEAAIKQFKAHLEQQKKGVITTGYYFNEGIFAEACQLYQAHFPAFGDVNSRKNRLAAIKVIGSIQRYFTTALAQAACQGFVGPFNPRRDLYLSAGAQWSFFHTMLGESHFVFNGDVSGEMVLNLPPLGMMDVHSTPLPTGDEMLAESQKYLRVCEAINKNLQWVIEYKTSNHPGLPACRRPGQS